MLKQGATYVVKFLGTNGYEGREDGRYGDCVIIYDANNTQKNGMIVYDCGSEEHADRVIEFASKNGIVQFDVILSHNHEDHFKGISKLVETGKVRSIFTTLLFKYVNDILKLLDDDRRTNPATKERIKNLYDGIAELGNTIHEYNTDLKDIYENENELPDGIAFVAPDKNTLLQGVAEIIKNDDLNTPEGDDTIVNATSLQIEVSLKDGNPLLLLGDATADNIECDLENYFYIQLPHHGKFSTAEAIFEKIGNNSLDEHTFIVSDNTGTTKAGSDELMKSKIVDGLDIKNTIDDDTVDIGEPPITTRHKVRENFGVSI